MKFAVLLFFLIGLAGTVDAQKLNKKFIKGKWKANAILIDSKYYIKIDDPKFSVNVLMTELKNDKPNYTTKDSLMVMDRWDQMKQQMNSLFFVFNKNGSFVLPGKTRLARYEMDKETNEILIRDGNEIFSSFKVNLKEKIIYMEGKMSDGKNMIYEFIKQ